MVSFASRCSLVWPQFSLLCQMLNVSAAYIEQAWWKNHLDTDVFLLSVGSCWFTSIPKTSYPTREFGTHVFCCLRISKECVHTMLCFNQQINKLNLGMKHIISWYLMYAFLPSKSTQVSGITWISCRSSAPRTSWPMTTVAMALAKALPRRKPAMSRSRPLWESGKEMVGGN